MTDLTTPHESSDNSQYSMDRIRLDVIEERRQKCSDIVRLRKRKLAELFCITTSPFSLKTLDTNELRDDQLESSMPSSSNHPFINEMLEFLEVNDLENDRLFNEITLNKFQAGKHEQLTDVDADAAMEKEEISNQPNEEPLKKRPKLDKPEENSTTTNEKPDSAQKEALAEKEKEEDKEEEKEIEDGKAHDDVIVENKKQQKQHEKEKQQEHPPTATPTSKTSLFDHNVTLLDMINKYTNDPAPKRADSKSSRDLNLDGVSIENLLVGLLPEKKPHKIAEARSLTELYYHQQTLPLPKLLLRAHKTLTTEAYETSLVEGKVAVLHSRIEELKRKNSWSLRQPRRFIDPFLQYGRATSGSDTGFSSAVIPNRKTHWDSLVSEGKWLSLDIKQARRWKMSQCVYIAQAVHDYWTYGKVCCIKRRKIVHLDEKKEVNEEKDNLTQEVNNKPAEYLGAEETQVFVTDKDGDAELLNSDSEHLELLKDEQNKEKASENLPVDLKRTSNLDDNFDNVIDQKTIESSAREMKEDPLPEFSYSEYSQKMSRKNPPFKLYADLFSMTAGEKSVVEQLPEYVPFSVSEVDHLVEREHYPHVSSLLPPVDEEHEWEKLVFKKLENTEKKSIRNKNGLFGPYRRINILKPPHPPAIDQLNIRIPTIWLPQDDKCLIKYVSEFSFNWDIISAHLTPRATCCYTSNIERRTPWQCFERYIQLNDKFQFTDMRGLFAEKAKKWLESAHRVQATTKRRISPLGVGTESIQRGHRRLRWASMFEAMKRIMKKRENEPKPSSKAQKYTNDGKRTDTPTPADLSLLKFERDRAMQESYGHSSGRLRISGRQISDQGRRLDTKNQSNQIPSSDKLTSQQQKQMQQKVQAQRLQQHAQQIGRVTTPNGTPLTSDQIQKLMQLKRQRQQNQRQAMLLQQQQQQQQQQSVAKAGSNTGNTGTSSQIQLAMLNQGKMNSTPPPPQGSPINVATSIMNQGSPPVTGISSPDRSKSPAAIVPTPEQVLQQVKPSESSSMATSPSPNASKQAKSSMMPSRRKVSWNNSQVQSLVAQIRAQNPNMDQDSVMRAVANLLHKAQMSKQQKQQQQQQQQQLQQLQPQQNSDGLTKYSIQQLDALINSPNVSDAQKLQLRNYKKKALERQAKTDKNANSVSGNNKSVMTTRFSPQVGTGKASDSNDESVEKWLNEGGDKAVR